MKKNKLLFLKTMAITAAAIVLVAIGYFTAAYFSGML